MIRYVEGNLLDAQAEALVNTVNTVGVMGKGIALQFKEEFSKNFTEYAAACKRGEVRVGHMFVTETGRLTGPRWIVNFPTKRHWRQPSKLEFVTTGLVDLVRVVREYGIRSLALPPLGCGNGGLAWGEVRQAIENALRELPDVDVIVFVPTDAYLTAPKSSGAATLTPARAILVDLVRKYTILGLECTHLEVQKLAYFQQRVSVGMGVPDAMKLQFQPNTYGPYADNLRHLVNGLDGSFLHLQKRAADAGAFDEVGLDAERLNDVDEFLSEQADQHLPALARVDELIDGFQSPYLMELLATVDWVLAERGPDTSVETILDALSEWPTGPSAAARKVRLFDERSVGLARERLLIHADVLFTDSRPA